MTDSDLLTLNAVEEAAGEPDDGIAGVVRVVLNRRDRRYFSDGTITGTVLAKDQFSWAWFAFETKHTGIGVHQHLEQSYVRVCHAEAEAAARAEGLLARIDRKAFAHCGAIAAAVVAGTYRGPDYDALGDDALLYLNPAILTHLPSWASPAKFEKRIGHHDFYRA